MSTKLFLTCIIVFSVLPFFSYSQIENIEGLWKITCALEINKVDASIVKCSICDKEKSGNSKIKDQFIFRFHSDTLTIIKMATTGGTNISFLFFPEVQKLKFSLDGIDYSFRIITADKDFVLVEENENRCLLMEKISNGITK